MYFQVLYPFNMYCSNKNTYTMATTPLFSNQYDFLYKYVYVVFEWSSFHM